METVSVPLSLPVFKRLQSYVEPIIDDQNTALTRIFDHWDATAPARKTTVTVPIGQSAKMTHCRTSRSVLMPIGLRIFANWNGQKLTAKVTEGGIMCDGKLYDDPSGAAKAAKLQRGASETTASTNGWTFWNMDAPGAEGKICSINRFRGKK